MELTESFFWLAVGGTVLIAGGEFLVRGATRLATLLKIPALIVGLTIVSLCTSAPELAVSLTGVLTQGGHSDIAVGNVVGSNICNILLVLGLAALLRPIAVSSRLIKREIPFLIFISALTIFFALWTVRGGVVEAARFPRWAGAVFVALLLAYQIGVVRSVGAGHCEEMSEEIQKGFQRPTDKTHSLAAGFFAAVMLAVGLTMLVYGADKFVEGATCAAKCFGVSPRVISLTVLAVGTSLPELTVSLIAALRGKNDIAVGNIIGSNTINLLGILGLTSALVPNGLALSQAVLAVDLPVMFVSTAVGGALCFTGRRLTRAEGLVLLVGYVVYVALLFYRG